MPHLSRVALAGCVPVDPATEWAPLWTIADLELVCRQADDGGMSVFVFHRRTGEHAKLMPACAAWELHTVEGSEEPYLSRSDCADLVWPDDLFSCVLCEDSDGRLMLLEAGAGESAPLAAYYDEYSQQLRPIDMSWSIVGRVAGMRVPALMLPVPRCGSVLFVSYYKFVIDLCCLETARRRAPNIWVHKSLKTLRKSLKGSGLEDLSVGRVLGN